jgi:hypothetical protein
VSALWAPTVGGGAATEELAGRPRRPRLRPVPPAPARLSRIPFIGVLIALFGLGMAGLLMLNTSLQTQVFQARALDRQATELAYGQAELESQIAQVEAPRELARRASALGLRPNEHPAFLVVPSGKVIGKPERVKGDESPLLVIKTPAERAAAKAAEEAKRLATQRAKEAKARADAAAAKATAARQAAEARARALQAQRQATAAEAAKQAQKKAGR